MTKILSMNNTIADMTCQIRTEHDESITAYVVASEAGHTIANYDGGDRCYAIEISDFGDGDAEFYEHAEGDTFDDEHGTQFVVKRTDNTGSLKWAEAETRD
jgi:hypothetical protein